MALHEIRGASSSAFLFLTEQVLRNRKPLADRFNAKVGAKTSNGCMEWTAQLYPNGYGSVWLEKPNKRGLAHRIAYSLVHGEIPSGMVVMHKCDNPKCVNVEHLQLGTQNQNIQDMVQKGRVKRSKLAPFTSDILRLRASGYSQQRIADEYGVSRPLVSMFLSGQFLNHIGA